MGGSIPARNRSYQKTISSSCRTEEAANRREVGGVHSSYAHRSTTKLLAGIVYQWVVWEAKAVHRQGDSTSSHQTYTVVIFRPLLMLRSVELTRTRTSCNRMDQIEMEERVPARNRSYQETISSSCHTGEVANLQEVDGVRSSYARRSMTKLLAGIVYQWVVSKAQMVHQQGGSTSSRRTYTEVIFRSPSPSFEERDSPELGLLAIGWTRWGLRSRWFLAAEALRGPIPVLVALRGVRIYIGTVGDTAALFITPGPIGMRALFLSWWLWGRRSSADRETALLLREPVLVQRLVKCCQCCNE